MKKRRPYRLRRKLSCGIWATFYYSQVNDPRKSWHGLWRVTGIFKARRGRRRVPRAEMKELQERARSFYFENKPACEQYISELEK